MTKLTFILAFAIAIFGSNVALATDFSYSLSSPLKPVKAGQCASVDVDNDCLDDDMEAQLAAILSPYYFWDESDTCNYYSAVDSDTSHGSTAGYDQNVPRFYYQVRPRKATDAPAGYPLNIRQWQSGNSWVYWVRVHYFVNYPTDCGFTGHQGDNEGTYYDLYSRDLQTWGLGKGYYPRHKDLVHILTGAALWNMSTGAGGSYPMVLADDHGHGSWEGWGPTSTWCGPNSQGNLFNNFYCLVGASLTVALQLGNYVYPSAVKNIGEPAQNGSSGAWNGNVLTLAGSPSSPSADVTSFEYTHSEWSTNPVSNMNEYWNDVSVTHPAYNRFCGWECGAGPKTFVTGGQTVTAYQTCKANVLGQQDCTGPMWSKVEKDSFDKCMGGTPCKAGDI